jgi:hypothetical protein
MHLCATNNGSGGRTAKKVQMPDFASVALPLSLQDGLAHCGAAFHSIASHAVRRLAVGRSQKADFRGGHGSLSIPLSAAPRCELLDGAYLEQVTGYLRCTEGAPLVLPRCVPAQDGGFALGQTATVYLTFTPSGYAYRPILPPLIQRVRPDACQDGRQDDLVRHWIRRQKKITLATQLPEGRGPLRRMLGAATAPICKFLAIRLRRSLPDL